MEALVKEGAIMRSSKLWRTVTSVQFYCNRSLESVLVK